MINDVLITSLDIIKTPNGSVLHALKKNEKSFVGFGEAYFSEIEYNSVKAWKRHKEMTLNLCVPIGKIRFVLYDDRNEQNCKYQEFVISKENYCRLTIPPMIWLGFQGLAKDASMLLNIANIMHNANEVDRKNIDEIQFDWRLD
tara:strand:- start:645 stop:1076 length:432 start_codon:yes stop_codon:yes gene_type:complete